MWGKIKETLGSRERRKRIGGIPKPSKLHHLKYKKLIDKMLNSQSVITLCPTCSMERHKCFSTAWELYGDINIIGLQKYSQSLLKFPIIFPLAFTVLCNLVRLTYWISLPQSTTNNYYLFKNRRIGTSLI